LINYFTAIPFSIPIRRYRYYLVSNVAYNFALLVHGSWMILFGVIGIKPLFFFNIFSVLFYILCIAINRSLAANENCPRSR